MAVFGADADAVTVLGFVVEHGRGSQLITACAKDLEGGVVHAGSYTGERIGVRIVDISIGGCERTNRCAGGHVLEHGIVAEGKV
jgi:hypothetical protein